MPKKVYQTTAVTNYNGNIINQGKTSSQRFRRERKVDFKVQANILKKKLKSIYPQYENYIDAFVFNESKYDKAEILKVQASGYYPSIYGLEAFNKDNIQKFRHFLYGDLKRAFSLSDETAEPFFNKLLEDGNLSEFMIKAIATAKEDDVIFEYIVGNNELFNQSVKPEDYDINQLYKANKAVAELIGEPELFGNIEDASLVQGEEVTDGVMITNNGYMASSDEITDKLLVKKNDDEIINKAREFNASSIKKLSDMNVFDYLTGNIADLSGDCYNIELTDDNQIKSISRNDFSHKTLFPSAVTDVNRAQSIKSLGIISEEMANKVLALNEEDYKKALADNKALSPAQIDAAWKSVEYLKTAIIEGKEHYAGVKEGELHFDPNNKNKYILRVTNSFENYNLNTLSKVSDESIYSKIYTGALFETGKDYIAASNLVQTKLEERPYVLGSDKFTNILKNERRDSNGNIIEDSEYYTAIKNSIRALQYSDARVFAANLKNLEDACDTYIDKRDGIFKSSAGRARINAVKDLKASLADIQFEYTNDKEIKAISNILLANRGIHPTSIMDGKIDENVYAATRKMAIDLLKEAEKNPDVLRKHFDDYKTNYDIMFNHKDGFIWEDYKNSDNPEKFRSLISKFNQTTKIFGNGNYPYVNKQDKALFDSVLEAGVTLDLANASKGVPVKDSEGMIEKLDLSIHSPVSVTILENGGLGTKVERPDSVAANAAAYTAYIKNISLEEADKLIKDPSGNSTVGKDYYIFMQDNPIEKKNEANEKVPVEKKQFEKSAANHAKFYNDWYNKILDIEIKGFDNYNNFANSNVDLISSNTINCSQNEENYKKVDSYYDAFNPNYKDDLNKYGQEGITARSKEYYRLMTEKVGLGQTIGAIASLINNPNPVMVATGKAIHELFVEKTGGLDGKKIKDLDPKIFNFEKYTALYTTLMSNFSSMSEDKLNNYLTNQLSVADKNQIKQNTNDTWDLFSNEMDADIEKQFTENNPSMTFNAIKNEFNSEDKDKSNGHSKDDYNISEKISFKEVLSEEGEKEGRLTTASQDKEVKDLSKGLNNKI